MTDIPSGSLMDICGPRLYLFVPGFSLKHLPVTVTFDPMKPGGLVNSFVW